MEVAGLYVARVPLRYRPLPLPPRAVEQFLRLCGAVVANLPALLNKPSRPDTLLSDNPGEDP